MSFGKFYIEHNDLSKEVKFKIVFKLIHQNSKHSKNFSKIIIVGAGKVLIAEL